MDGVAAGLLLVGVLSGMQFAAAVAGDGGPRGVHAICFQHGVGTWQGSRAAPSSRTPVAPRCPQKEEAEEPWDSYRNSFTLLMSKVGPGGGLLGMAWHGVARRGMVRYSNFAIEHGIAWQGIAWHGCGVAWHGVAWQGAAWQGMGAGWHGCGVAWVGMAWRDRAWHGVAWHWHCHGTASLAWHGTYHFADPRTTAVMPPPQRLQGYMRTVETLRDRLLATEWELGLRPIALQL